MKISAQFGIGCQMSHPLLGLATGVGLREEVQTPIDYLNGDRGERLIDRFDHCVSEIHPNHKEQPGGPDLYLECILSPTVWLSDLPAS